jgi:hypothetical protein
MTNQFSKELMDQFKKLTQDCGVAEMDTPGVTKDSRESLHDTSHATDSIKDWRTFWNEVLDDETETNKYKEERRQKTIDEFLDTICCALEEMSGKETLDCFVEAVKSQHEYTTKEYEKTKELMEPLSLVKDK